MEKLEVTSMSSRGQVVIPQDVRKNLHLHEGEKFVVVAEDDTILLKKIEAPSFKNFDRLLKKTRQFAQRRRISEQTVEEAVKYARK